MARGGFRSGDWSSDLGIMLAGVRQSPLGGLGKVFDSSWDPRSARQALLILGLCSCTCQVFVAAVAVQLCEMHDWWKELTRETFVWCYAFADSLQGLMLTVSETIFSPLVSSTCLHHQRI